MEIVVRRILVRLLSAAAGQEDSGPQAGQDDRRPGEMLVHRTRRSQQPALLGEIRASDIIPGRPILHSLNQDSVPH